MRRSQLTLALAVGTVLLVVGLPAWAMTGTLEVKIPFTFEVQNTALPAGTYEISTPDLNAPNLLLIRSQRGVHSVFVEAEPVDHPALQQQKAELVFNKMGSTEFLTQVWFGEDGYGSQIPEPKLHMQVSHQTTDAKSVHSLAAHHRHPKNQGMH